MLDKKYLTCSLCGTVHNVSKMTAGAKFLCSRCKRLNVVPSFDDWPVYKPEEKIRTQEVVRQGNISPRTSVNPIRRPAIDYTSSFNKKPSLETGFIDYFLPVGFVFSMILIIIAIFIKILGF